MLKEFRLIVINEKDGPNLKVSLVFRYTNLKRTKHISHIKYVLSFDLFFYLGIDNYVLVMHILIYVSLFNDNIDKFAWNNDDFY